MLRSWKTKTEESLLTNCLSSLSQPSLQTFTEIPREPIPGLSEIANILVNKFTGIPNWTAVVVVVVVVMKNKSKVTV